MKNPLIVVVGRTASGKDTFIGRIETEERTMAKSYTTRPRRMGEGNTHIFIDSVEGYNDRILETTINNYHYFLTSDDLKEHDILLIDPIGVKELIELDSFKRPIKIIYLDVARKIRQARYINRDKSSLSEFINRDMSESSQFTSFEEFISYPNIMDKYDVEILSTDEDIDQLVDSLDESR